MSIGEASSSHVQSFPINQVGFGASSMDQTSECKLKVTAGDVQSTAFEVA